jgi:phosphate transport system permease protein
VLSGGAAALGIVMLSWVLLVVLKEGAAAIRWDFFFHAVTPPGIAGGGVGNAILGSAILVLLAVLLGAPIGILAGVYLAEFGRDSRIGSLVRFSANVMMGIPSIIVGLFVYTIMVLSTGTFSGWAGATALAILMLPVISRTTEDMLALVPNALRESALALGAPRWKVTVGIVFRAAKSGLLTGVLLAVARISGETAPLLFTCLNSPYWPKSLNTPVANLPVTVFNCAMSPYADWRQLAWGASFLITMGVLALTLTARFVLRKR